jgi:cation diffusion facilitator CzcD-associated flavoprotein CzcO
VILDALVIGGGPAGLAVSFELQRFGAPHLVIERGDQPGYVWANLYDSLTLHTGRHMSSLPGRGFPRGTPLFPPRPNFVSYLHEYAAAQRLPIRTGVEARAVTRLGDRWRVDTTDGVLDARRLAVATGIVSSPRRPVFPDEERFRGRILHSVDYRRPAPFKGRRVLVVGAGNSAGEIASELARAGVATSIAVRSGAHVVPRSLLGIPIQYLAYAAGALPAPLRRRLLAGLGAAIRRRQGPPVLPTPGHGLLESIPLIGLELVNAIRRGEIPVYGGVGRFTAGGVVFAGGEEAAFDDVVLATGYRPALGFLGDLVRVDDRRGFAVRTDRVASADQRDLYFVGHNYDHTGGLFNIRRDAPVVARRIASGR